MKKLPIAHRRSQGLAVWLEPELKRAIDCMARDDGRSASDLLRKLAEEYVRATQSEPRAA
jgi:hypothetical protein